ncbi:MAG TPA: acyl-CoA thioesterase [Candidatus Methylomirabilis sp.]|nr:acyl-CoA thioesterase [Candidatus Methylomirabilis sp.]
MLSICDTATEMVNWVFPEHAGAPGQIHGGRMMQWIATCGTIAASRVARGNVVLGAMDDIDFLHPVKVGEVAVLQAQVEYVGRCSLEVGVRVYAEKPATGERVPTLSSHLVFVKVDERVKPVPVAQQIVPRGADEEALFVAAQRRRTDRLRRFAQRAERALEIGDDGAEEVRWRFESCRSILPEEALFGDTMFAGKLLMDIDEAGGILSMRYCRGLVMTACLDALDFYSPISSSEVVTFKAGLNHVGTSSLEVGVKVLTEVPWTGEVRHACTAYLSFVHLGPDLRPRPCPPFLPSTPPERRRWQGALERRARRLERVEKLKASINEGR